MYLISCSKATLKRHWGVLSSCWWWGGEAEDPVRISIVNQGLSDMELLSSPIIGECTQARCNIQQPYGQWGGGPDTCQYVLLSWRLWWIGSHQDGGWLLCQRNRACRSSLTQRVNWIDGSTELRWVWKAWTWSGGCAMQVSSTYLFQKGGGSGYVETALCSTSSMMRSATMTDTRDPMAVPKDCW